MPNHSGISHCNPSGNLFNVASDDAFFTTHCGHCGARGVAAVIAHTIEGSTIRWLRCTSCQMGSVAQANNTYPSSMPADDLEGLPPEVEDAYNEARRCFASNAFTGCELLCRKLLMYVAFDKCGKDAGKSFASYIDALGEAGYITPPMRPWVDRIREHANDATHKLDAPSRDRAELTLAFTMQLLRIVYEMEYQARKGAPLEPGTSE